MRTLILLVLLSACRTPEKPDDSGPTTPDDTGPDIVDNDGDGYGVEDDCDDSDAAIHPGADEACDGIDNDCDGDVDEGLLETWYADTDGDGYGDADEALQACEQPPDTAADATDCDDADDEVHPGAAERCDGVDNDCDEAIDEDLQEIWYADADGDGFGNASNSQESCDPGEGWVSDSTDCDDANSSVNPGAAEVCNDADDDCNDRADEGLELAWFQDADGDGYGDPSVEILDCEPGAGWIGDDSDCDDANSEIHPTATEICNGLDDDCDGLSDDQDSPVYDTDTWYQDSDADGYGDSTVPAQACQQPRGYAALGGDCDDSDDSYNPGAAEPDCTDPADYNCDGSTGYADDDGDGWAACADCDDSDASINDDGIETCDRVDNDCDGTVDEHDAVDATAWYADADGDGYGDAASSTVACAAPSGHVADSTDCDDGDRAKSPGASEICNGTDDDCDGLVDDDDPGVIGGASWFADTDADGFGNPAFATTACVQPSGWVGDDSDCDDTDPDAWPGNDETCDGSDNDCDGTADEDDALDAGTWYSDADGDGYGDPTTADIDCEQPSGTVSDASDCDDADSSTNPGASEICDGIDNDCDGTVDVSPIDGDTWYSDADGDGYGDPTTATTTCSQPSGTVADASDCADSDSTAYPGSTATETPWDGVDQDCDGADTCTDLNCDGLPDLLFPSYQNDSSKYTSSRAFYGTGYGFASSHGTTLDSVGPLAALVEDLNGDGYQDIVLGSYYDGTTRLVDSYIYWGSAAGYSSSDRSDLGTEGVIAVRARDLDADGYTDLIFASHYGTSYASTSMIYWGSASGYSDGDRTELATYGAYDLEVADLDGDGWDELIFAQYYSGSSYAVGSYVYWGSAAGYSTSDLSVLPTTGAVAVDVEDLNGDGWLDVVFACYYSGSSHGTYSYVYWGSSSGPVSTNYDALYTYGAWDVASGDFDDDGFTDLVFASYYSSSSYTTTSYIYWGNTGGYSSSDRTGLTSYGARAVVAEDLDLDGWEDLFFAHYYSGSTYSYSSWLYWGSSAGYSTADLTGLATDGGFRAQAADVDEDGWPDLIVNCYRSDSSFEMDSYVYYGSSAGYSSTDRDDLPVDGPWSKAVVVGL